MATIATAYDMRYIPQAFRNPHYFIINGSDAEVPVVDLLVVHDYSDDIFHLRSTGVSAIMYGLQNPHCCTLRPATRTRYCVPFSTS